MPFTDKRIVTATAVAFLMATPVHGADGHGHHSHDHSAHAHKDGPHFFGHLDLLVHADSIYNADDNDTEIDEVYSHSHLALGFALNRHFSIQSRLKLEGESAAGGHHHGGEEEEEDEAKEGLGGDNRYFDDHPLLVEQLTLNYDTDNYALYAGKFNPVVGIDYHGVPGIWTYQTLEEYAIRERLGVGGAYIFNTGDYGTHRLDVSTFFADTTALSGSLLFDRGDTSESDGGVSNTKSFESFAVSLGGSDFYSLDVDFIDDFSYRLGFAHQAAGDGNDDDENRFSATLGYNPQFTSNLSAHTFVEYVSIQHLEGEADHDRAFLTAAGGLYYGPWNVAVSHTSIMNDAGEPEEDQDGYMFQVSTGYRLQEGALKGLGVDVGWKTQEEEGEQRETVGALLSYAIAF